MTTFAVPASPRASTTPNVTRTSTPEPGVVFTDRDGNTAVDTPLGRLTHVEYDVMGELIEDWPTLHLDPTGDPFTEADLAAHAAAVQAFLAVVDPSGTNRLPEPRRATPLVAPAPIERVVERPVTVIAAELTEQQARVLAGLAMPGASFDDPDHGRTWDLGRPEEREAFTDADHACVLALTDAGLLVGYRPTPLGCQVDNHARQAAGLGEWDTAVAS